MTCDFPRIAVVILLTIIGFVLLLTADRGGLQQDGVTVTTTALVSSTTNAAIANRAKATPCKKPCVVGDESILMQPKEYGTSSVPIQTRLRWNCDRDVATRICNNNRHYAEYFGYWERDSTFVLDEIESGTTTTTTTTTIDDASSSTRTTTLTFYDSNSGVPLFTIPGTLQLRSVADFIQESHQHGWPSFRTDEVHWDYVRVLPNGETVSINGTHLGHNLPDNDGDRFCINLVCIAGNPM